MLSRSAARSQWCRGRISSPSGPSSALWLPRCPRGSSFNSQGPAQPPDLRLVADVASEEVLDKEDEEEEEEE